MKIAVIGPIRPYRGGIAVSNTILCENLAKNHEVFAISFKRLFPKILYPGRFQKTNNIGEKWSFYSEECLDSINPLNWRTTAGKINQFKPDLVIFQWWTTFLSPCYCYLAKALKSPQLVANMHNIVPREKRLFDKFLADSFFKKLDRFVALSKQDAKTFKTIYPYPIAHISEPDYRAIVKNKYSKEQARKILGIPEDEKSVLFFGFVRPYKDINSLLQATQMLEDIRLYVIGEWWEKKEKYAGILNQLGSKVLIVDRYISDKESELYFSACNVIALPYATDAVPESGIIQLALAFNLPIITTAIVGNSNAVKDNETGIILKDNSPQTIAKAINDYFEKDLEAKFREAMERQNGIQWTKETENKVLYGEREEVGILEKAMLTPASNPLERSDLPSPLEPKTLISLGVDKNIEKENNISLVAKDGKIPCPNPLITSSPGIHGKLDFPISLSQAKQAKELQKINATLKKSHLILKKILKELKQQKAKK